MSAPLRLVVGRRLHVVGRAQRGQDAGENVPERLRRILGPQSIERSRAMGDIGRARPAWLRVIDGGAVRAKPLSGDVVSHAEDMLLASGAHKGAGADLAAHVQTAVGEVPRAKADAKAILRAAIFLHARQCEIPSALDVYRQRVTEAVGDNSVDRHAPIWWVIALARRGFSAVAREVVLGLLLVLAPADRAWVISQGQEATS